MEAQAMTFDPILPWWIMGTLAVATMALLVRMLLKSWHGGEGGAAGSRAGFRDWLFRGSLLALLILAATRPGIPGGQAPAAATDLNVFFVVDTTSSMVAEDFGKGRPRLDGVREDIRTISSELSGARCSLITFDSSATVRLPLTRDTSSLETGVSLLGPQVTAYSTGSSVTMAGEVLRARLEAARESHPERPRIVYYLGDGEQTSAERPRQLDVDQSLVDGGAVLGYGTAEGGRMRENTGSEHGDQASYIQDHTGGGSRDAISRIDEGRLRDIAVQLGVPYVHRSAGAAADPVFQDARPGTLDRTGEHLDGRTELYWVPALAGLLLALREAAMAIVQLRMLRPNR
jgi:Ca-activated chloride channel family protein